VIFDHNSDDEGSSLGWYKPKGAKVGHSQEQPAPATSTSKVVWRKSAASTSGGASCLEVALMPDLVLVRDSKDTEGPRLKFTPTVWAGFVETLR
jgi:hypothetical protein